MIEQDQAIEIARKRAEEKGWEFNEPVNVFTFRKWVGFGAVSRFEILENAGNPSTKAHFVIDAKTGVVLSEEHVSENQAIEISEKYIKIPLFMLVVFALSPVLMPFGIISYYFDLRRLRAAANKTACPTCGRTLGIEALRQADQYWKNCVAEIQKANPGIRFRLVRLVHAICVHCQTHLCYHEDTGTFTKTED